MNLKRQPRTLLPLLLIVPALASFSTSAAPPLREDELAATVHKAIVRQPYYSVFDLVSFQVRGNDVFLGGSVYNAPLKRNIVETIREIPGVGRVSDRISVQPVSFEDDRLRRQIFYKIYTDNVLSKYGTPVAGFGRRIAGAGWGNRGYRGGLDQSGFLGLHPLGNYAIHIVVDRGRVSLYGEVLNDVDRMKAEMDVKQVFGVRAINNRILVVDERDRD